MYTRHVHTAVTPPCVQSYEVRTHDRSYPCAGSCNLEVQGRASAGVVSLRTPADAFSSPTLIICCNAFWYSTSPVLHGIQCDKV